MDTERITRRELLQGGLAVAATGLAATACDRVPDPYALSKASVPGSAGQRLGEERSVVTACDQCPLQCGVKVRVVEGRAVKIDGLRDDPVCRGGVGPRGQSGLDVVYHPDRVRSPLKRVGARGSGSFQPIGWEQAIAEVGAALTGLRDRGEAHRLVVLCGRERGLMNELWARFCAVYGTPNFLETSRHGPAGPLGRAMSLATGAADVPAYDIARSAYILSLGSGIVEGGRLGGYAARAIAEARQSRPGRRAKLLQIEPSYSLTAAAADEWIPVRPGTLAHVALALGHILVERGLHDREFVRDHVFGFEPWKDADGTPHEGYAELLRRHDPEAVAARCGISAETLARIAGELGRERPAVVVVDERSTFGPDGLEVARAALALCALLGSVDRAGGVLFQRRAPLAGWPDLAVNQAGSPPRIDAAALVRHPLAVSVPEALTAPTYAPAAVFLYYTNPAFSFAQPQRVRLALEQAPLVVSFSPFLDESAAVADYVLPDHTFLERWDGAEGAPSVGFPIFRLRRPAVTPLYATRHTGDAVIGLARAIGGPVAAAFAWDDYHAAVVQRATGITGGEGAALESGLWVDPRYSFEQWTDVLRTPSGRFELYSQEALARYRQAGVASRVALDALCLGEPASPGSEGEGDPATFPLTFLPYLAVSHVIGGPQAGHLDELGDPQTGMRWGPAVELNPRTARSAGIRDGDLVTIASPAGRFQARALLFDGVPPDAARMAIGAGSRRGAARVAATGNPCEILSTEFATTLGRPAIGGVRVRVTKVMS